MLGEVRHTQRLNGQERERNGRGGGNGPTNDAVMRQRVCFNDSIKRNYHKPPVLACLIDPPCPLHPIMRAIMLELFVDLFSAL